MNFLIEPAREIPVQYETDVCVIGGGMAGVFAAIRAARAGVHVVLVEQGSCFGGVATQSMVNNWHSIWDEDFEQQIIGGLIIEVIDRLKKRNAIHINENY